MNKRLFGLQVLLALLLVILVGCQKKEPVQQAAGGQLLVVGYLLTHNTKRVDDTMASRLTDIIYFSVEPTADGGVDQSRIKSSDIEHLQAFKEKHDLRILLAVGGWGRSEHFAAMSTNAATRNKFIAALHQLCLTHNLDGIDYDWEFPETDEQKQAYNNLIIETSRAVKADGLIVTTALSPWQKLSAEAYQSLDRVHIMAYDQGQRHSTYETAVKCVETFAQQGIERSKLCLGVPFYGRKMADTQQSITYRQIVEKYQPTPDTDETDGYYYNGPTTIQKKVRYCAEQNIGGVMIWELGQDTSDDTSLLKAIDEIRNGGQ